MSKENEMWEVRYRKRAAALSSLGYISQGSVYVRPKGKPGSKYLWSWKNANQKTESLSLSAEQYQWIKKAIANHRKAERILADLRQISRSVLLKTIPGPKRRK
jgi:hypothetical protein